MLHDDAAAPSAEDTGRTGTAVENGEREGVVRAPAPAWVRAAWYPLLALFVVVPLSIFPALLTTTNPYGASAFVTPKLFTLGALTAAALAAWAVALWRGDIAVRDVPGKWWAVGFMALLLASTATALSPMTAVFGQSQNLVGLFTFIVCAAVFFLATQLVKGAGRMRLLSRSLMLGGFAVSVVGLIQVTDNDPLGMRLAENWMYERAASTIGNPDFTGTFFVLPLVLAVALALSEDDRRWRAVSWAAAVSMGSALFFTLTRGAWIGALVGLVALTLAVRRYGRGVNRKAALAALAAVGGIALASVSIPWIRAQLLRRVAELSSGLTVLSGGRTYIWRDALALISRHPLLGVGPDSYRLGWFPVRSLADVAGAGANMVTNDAHNILLTLAATLGVPAALLAAGLTVAVLARAFRGAFPEKADADRIVYSGWWAGVAGLAAAMMFSVNTIVVMLAFAVGLAVLVAPRSRPAAVSRRPVARIAAGAAIALAAVFVAVPTMTLVSDYTIARAATNSPDVELVRTALRQAPWSAPARNLDAYYSAAIAVGSLQADDPSAEALFDEADRKTAELVAFNPYEYDSYRTRARLFADAGAVLGASTLESAVQAADEGLRVQPNGIPLKVVKARALNGLKRYDETVGLLKDVWGVDADYSPAGVVYAEALIASGKRAEAGAVLDTLRARFPRDPEVARVTGLLGGSR